MVNDDDLADMMAAQPETSGAPRVAEYTPEVARLDLLIDRLGDLIGVTVQVAGGKTPRIRPAPRPETAIGRAVKRRTERRIESLIAEVEAAQKRAEQDT